MKRALVAAERNLKKQAKMIRRHDIMIDNLNLEMVRLKSINPANDCDTCSSLHDELTNLKSAYSLVALSNFNSSNAQFEQGEGIASTEVTSKAIASKQT